MSDDLPNPLCRKCSKPVDRFTRGREFRRGNVRFFESECHGEKERVEYWPLKLEGTLFAPASAFPADRPPVEMARADNPDPNNKNVLDIEDEMIAMPEWKRLARIERFAVSPRLLERNARELQDLLRFLTLDSRSWALSDIKRRAELDDFFEEVLRLLHNFVAAVQTLVDHTRVMHAELYKEEGLFPEYEAEIERRFVAAPLAQFVQKLRHLAQHVRLPAVSYQLEGNIEVGGARRTRRLTLLKSDLLRFGGWNAQANAYLGSAPEEIDIAEVVEAYVNEVRTFYEWLHQRQQEIHAADVSAVADVQARARALLAPEIPRLLELDLDVWAKGMGVFQDIFGFAFCPEDWVELSRYEGDLVAWTEAALALTQERFGPLPADLVARIRDAAEHGRSPPQSPP